MSLNESNSEHFAHIVAKSPKMKSVIEQALKFAVSDAPLLIQGETGTGKDLIAKACHLQSPRGSNKFIAVNCAGLPHQDAESEMFGRGGSENESLGFFEYANGGTVLLDSVAELSLELQAKLLRFLNDGTFRRVGEEQEHYADVRVICTSQVPLQHYVDEGKMRSDLFHRLNVLTLNIPPLRERKEDLPDLVRIFVQQISKELGISEPHFDTQFLQYLQDHLWKGNVRELYNALYRACSLAENNQLTIAGLNLNTQENMPMTLEQFGDETLEEIMQKFESAVLRKFYEQYPSTRKLAARLGVSHTAIANKLRQYGISK
ncbi:TPA: sigma 54-interacting transcriptional regulator [Pasteurella multocida]|nr:sigma 54-interacting transcriptional regulator [Pasteurella multocida]